MEESAAAGPRRFECPPDFSPSLFCPGAPFSPEKLQDPSKELWLIRAPTSFIPESLDGHSVPLLGLRTLKTSQPNGTEKVFHIQTALEHLGGAKLLLPSGHGDHLTCSPPFSGSLSICERYGDPSSNQPLFPVAAKPPLLIPEGLKQRFLPFGNHPGRVLLPTALEEPPRKKRKKKKYRLGEENPEEQTSLGETAGAGETEARGHREVDGTAPLATGSRPGSAAVAQNRVLSGEAEDLAPVSKKKKRRKEDRELKEERGAEAETGHQPEDAAAPPSSTDDARDGVLSGEAEEPGPRRKKKKKKRKEMKVETEAASPCQVDGTLRGEVSFQPNPTTRAQDDPLSGEAEGPAPLSKKKKKKVKEDGEPKGEVGGEAEATALWGIASQPKSEPVAQDSLPPVVANDPGPKSKKKKKRKEDQEVKEETRAEAEAASLPEENGTTPWGISSQQSSGLVARDCLLSGEAEDPAFISPKKKKKKKRKEGVEVKEEAGGEAEGLPELGSQLGGGSEPQAGQDSLPGMEEVTRGTSEEMAASPELFSSQEDTAGELWGFSGPGPTPEGGLVGLVEEDPGAGSSSHKAKKKKKRKERSKEAAQELEGWPGRGVESSAELGGGGERETLREKRKKEHHKRQAAPEEGGSS